MPSIAEVTGFHTSNLSRIERTVHQPTVDTLDRLAAADAYGCPWWSDTNNAVFLRALAYHLTQSAAYSPRQAEWWPADMSFASAAATVIAKGTTWSHSVRWPTLVEIWPALGLPRWQTTAALSHESPPTFTRPLWLWGSWQVTLELKDDEAAMAAWVNNISGHDDTDLATVVLGAILEAVERWRSGPPTESKALPDDSDFRAIVATWPSLTSPQRRLIRELVQALPRP